MESSCVFSVLDQETLGEHDILFLYFILAAGHTLSFHIVKLYDHEKPIEKEWNGKKYTDWSSIEKIITIEKLNDFCLSDSHCKIIDGETLYEAVITNVTIDGIKMSYGKFVFTINRIFDYIEFTLNNLNHFKSDYEYQVYGGDSATKNEIVEIGSSASALIRNELLSHISNLAEQEVTLSDGTKIMSKVVDDKFYDMLKKLK